MTILNNATVALNFAKNKTEGRSTTMFIEKDKVYSYGKHFCIAERIGRHRVRVTTAKYSKTTSKHTSLVLNALQKANWTILLVLEIQ